MGNGITGQAMRAMALIFLGGVVAWSSAMAETSAVKPCITSGKRKIFNENIPAARQGAVNNALEMAVQTAVTDMVPRQALAGNLEFIYDRLLAHPSDFVITYKVLGGVAHQGNYLVGVESKINLGLLEKRLTTARILNGTGDKPIILLLIAEQNPDEILPRYWWGNHPKPYAAISEDLIRRQMTKKQFSFVAPGPEYPDPGTYNVHFKSIYDTEAAMDLGTALGANLVVMGRTQAAESINRTGDGKIFDADIELEIFDLGSRKRAFETRIKAAAKSDGEMEQGSNAISKATEQAALDLVAKLDQFWSKKQRRENSFDLTIQGEGDHFMTRFIALKQKLKAMPGIENMQPKELVSSSASSRAVMEMVYKGAIRQFADRVMLKTFEGFGIETSDVTDTGLIIRFIEKQGNLPQKMNTPVLKQKIDG